MIMPSPHPPETAILVPRPNSIPVSHCCHKRCDFKVLKTSLTAKEDGIVSRGRNGKMRFASRMW